MLARRLPDETGCFLLCVSMSTACCCRWGEMDAVQNMNQAGTDTAGVLVSYNFVAPCARPGSIP